MSKTNLIERTAKYFGVSAEKASAMLKESATRNAIVQAKGEDLAQRVREGKKISYVTR